MTSLLTNLDAMTAFEKWDELLPKVIADQMKHKGRYVAVPVNVHRVNWQWANSAVLRKAGVTTLPTTYEALFDAADKIGAAGYLAIAHGSQDWQTKQRHKTKGASRTNPAAEIRSAR